MFSKMFNAMVHQQFINNFLKTYYQFYQAQTFVFSHCKSKINPFILTVAFVSKDLGNIVKVEQTSRQIVWAFFFSMLNIIF